MADEVVDEGDAWLVRRGAQRERVALSNLTNVSVSSQPQVRITLRLGTARGIGPRIVSLPERSGGTLFGHDSIVEDRIGRVHRAPTRASR